MRRKILIFSIVLISFSMVFSFSQEKKQKKEAVLLTFPKIFIRYFKCQEWTQFSTFYQPINSILNTENLCNL